MTADNSQSATGARPQGAKDEASAALAVQQMFDSIAPRYDLLNHVLSANIDRLWWWRAARTFHPILVRPEARVLDLCCGTGDMTLALLKHRPPNLQTLPAQPIIAADFAHQMLVRGAKKFAPRGAVALEADALHLPIAANSLDLVTSAFGFRNLANYEAGLAELHRVLRPGGEIGILDFSEPDGITGKLYAFYFRRVLPAIGSVISGVTGPYAYLPSSVQNFPPPQAMLEKMQAAGFRNASWTPYTFGIAGLYRAVKI
jgi:demethylmenaquinone methyltransferase/2-methoxy-6-polyprenyl-1,4-benzoquinol methylase